MNGPRRTFAAATVTWAASASAAAGQATDAITVYAAGSLRAALTEIAAAFETQPGGRPVRLVFGASGLLKDHLQTGEAADLFASANMEHPQAVGRERGVPTVLFARNRLCALARLGLEVTPETLLDRMLDPAVKLGTSTPRVDLAGDYAFALVAQAEAVRPGARAARRARR